MQSSQYPPARLSYEHPNGAAVAVASHAAGVIAEVHAGKAIASDADVAITCVAIGNRTEILQTL